VRSIKIQLHLASVLVDYSALWAEFAPVCVFVIVMLEPSHCPAMNVRAITDSIPIRLEFLR